MEVDSYLFNWLLQLKIIDDNERKNFISNDKLELLNSGIYFDRILFFLQKAYNEYYNLQLYFLENIKEINPLSENQISVNARYSNWKIIFDILSNFGLKYNEDDLDKIANGNKDFLLEILYKINELYNNLINKNINNLNNEITDNNNLDYENIERNNNEPLNIDTLNINKDYELCNSAYELFLISLCKNLKVNSKQSEKLLSNNRQYLAILCNKGINNSFDRIKNWLNDLDINIDSLIKIIRKNPNEKLLSYQIIGIGLCCKETEIIMKCINILNKLKTQIGNHWEWLKIEGIDSFIFSIIKNQDKKLNILKMLYEFIKSDLNDFFVELKKRILDKQRKRIYEFISSIISILNKTNFIFSKEFQKFILDICLNDNEDMTLTASILGESFYYFFPIEENKAISIFNYLKNCIRNKKEIIFSVAISQVFFIIEKLSEIKNKYAPLLYKDIINLFLEDYDNLIKREFILLNFGKFFRKYPRIPIDIFLNPYLDLILKSQNYSLSDFIFLMRIIAHPKIKYNELKNIIQFILNVSLYNVIYSRFGNLILSIIFVNQVIENNCTETQIYDLQEVLIDHIKKAFKLFIYNLNKIEDKILLETPYEIIDKKFKDVNQNVLNDLKEAIKIYRIKKNKNSNALIKILSLYDDYGVILKELDDNFKENYEEIDIESLNRITENETVKKITEEYQIKNKINIDNVGNNDKKDNINDINEELIENQSEIIYNENNENKPQTPMILKVKNYSISKNNKILKEQKLLNQKNIIPKNNEINNDMVLQKKKKKDPYEKYIDFAKSLKIIPSKFPEEIFLKEEEENKKKIIQKIEEFPVKYDRNLITTGDLNSNLNYAMITAKLNMRKKKIYIKPKNINKFEEENDYFRARNWELLTYEEKEEIKQNEEEIKLLQKIQKSIVVILPEKAIIKDNYIKVNNVNKKENNNNKEDDEEYIFKEKKNNIDDYYEFFPIPICLKNEEEREIKAIETYKNKYLREIKKLFNDFSNDINKKMKTSVLLKLLRDKNFDNKSLNIHEFNLSLVKIFGEKTNDLTYEQFNEFLIQISYITETKIRLNYTISECYGKFLQKFFSKESDFHLSKIYKKMKPVLKLIKYNLNNKINFNLPPGFKIIKKTDVLYHDKFSQNILNILGESKYICYKIIKEIIFKAYESNIFESYVDFYNYEDIEIDPLNIHNWNSQMTIYYMNLNSEYKKIGIEVCDVLNDELNKFCKGKDKDGNIILNSFLKKQNEDKINKIEIEHQRENDRIKRKIFLKSKIDKYNEMKKDKLKNKIESEKNEREKILGLINIKDKNKEEKKENEKSKEEIKERIKEKNEFTNTLKNNISYLQNNKEYCEFEKNLNITILNLLEREDIKEIINKYNKHLKTIYEIYSKIGINKLTFQNIGTIHLNQFKELLSNYSILKLLISTDQMNYIFNKITKKKEEESYLTYNDFLMSIIYLSIFSKFANRSRKLLPEDIENTNSETIETFIKFFRFEFPFNKNKIETFINDRRAMKYKDLFMNDKELINHVNILKHNEILKENQKKKELKKNVSLKVQQKKIKESEENEKKLKEQIKKYEKNIDNI